MPAGLPALADADVPSTATTCPVVGIGCSAGGLGALEAFFAAVPPHSGLAYVVVQHLSPQHESALPQLLGRHTALPVLEVDAQTVVQPDHVYTIPPARAMTLAGNRLLLSPPASGSLHLPIDLFLESLALARQAQAVGVLLSGMGSDGTRGLAAIHAHGGLTLAQTPASAQAEPMPRSAIDAGVVDIVALPGELPLRIADLRSGGLVAPAAPQPAEAVAAALDRINGLLREHSGNDFSLYKPNTLLRRIERRMAVRHVDGIDAYARLLATERQELDMLSKELLIGVTSFFRDPEVWQHLRDVALPALLADRPAGRPLRAWVAGCSRGEEAYTLAMVFCEAVARMAPQPRCTLQIYATDLDAAAIDVARRGVYPEGIAADVSAERLARFFTPEEGGGHRIAKRLREMVVFAQQNIAADPPFTKLDVLSCRNLLIYFGVPLQKRLMPMFHYALQPGGLLVLGSSESVGGFGELFTPLTATTRIFQRSAGPQRVPKLAFTPRSADLPEAADDAAPADRADTLGALTDQLIQQTFAPPAVLVNADGDILYISGRTGRYLEPAAGKTNINVHAMAREGLREALAGMIRKALKEQPVPVLLQGLQVQGDNGPLGVDVTVQAIDRPEALRDHVLIVFRELPPTPARRRGTRPAGGPSQAALAQALEQARVELQQAREGLQATQEEMQTTVEELRSSNEELQSTNEELQSANEELTTSKEELQSVNEELQTVNAELQSRVDDLTWVKNDMTNLLNSTELATVFLDGDLHLRRYTPNAVKLFRLIPGDVGRPLSDVVTELDHPALVDDAREVLRSLIFKESSVRTHAGRWFRVRVMPYRTLDNVIDGVVMTFTDITDIKQLEAALRQRQT
jgi:two-component system CheB/CheR fusion protein